MTADATDRQDEAMAASDGRALPDDALHASLPGADQTAEAIERWVLRAAVAGTVAVVRHVQRGLCEYHLDEMIRINSAARRVYLAQHGGFGFDGAGVSGARGQLTLLEPLPDVLDAAISGKTWQRGRPAFKRPLSRDELRIAEQIDESRG